jgi:shikimate kinase
MDAILEKTDSYYLKAGIGTLSERLMKEKDHRPLIADLNEEKLTEFIAKHLFERRNFYEKAATIISIDGKNPEQIASEINHSR